MPQRTAEVIRKEIINRFGFVPPFFEPAMPYPGVLENLWQQTVTAYIDNPIPALFKEKLAALLSRFCKVQYCLICHVSSLRPLGMTGKEIYSLLSEKPLSPEELKQKELAFENRLLKTWPESGSEAEDIIFKSSVAIFSNQDADVHRKLLKNLLPIQYYEYLNLFLAYNRSCLTWAESHPKLNYLADQRVVDHLEKLLSEDKELANMFRDIKHDKS